MLRLSKKPGIAVFDMSVSRTSPAGSCVLAEVEGLRKEYSLVIFSGRFEGETDADVTHIRVPLPQRPIVLRYCLFQLLAPLIYYFWRLFNRKPALVQTTGGQYFWADLVYAHFCHRAYLKGAWEQAQVNVSGMRRIFRRMNYGFNSLMEPIALRNARIIVVPSLGLQRDMSQCYPHVANKIRVIPNPVDIDRFSRPADLDRTSVRSSLGFDDSHTVFVFVALGNFSHKGLGLVLRALAELSEHTRESARLLVVGGNRGEIEQFRSEASLLGVDDKSAFVGMQQDVRPYLWASDVLAFPSAYETFSLAAVQAAAAGLPHIVSQGLYGVEEYAKHGVTGWVVPRDVREIRAAMQEAVESRETLLPAMSAAAQTAIQHYSIQDFKERWRRLCAELIHDQESVARS